MCDYFFSRYWIACLGSLTLIVSPLQAELPGTSSEEQIRQPLAFSLVQSDTLGDVQYTSDLIQTGCDYSCDTCCDGGANCGDCVACGCAKCKKKKKPNPGTKSHKGVFYDNNFSYLNDPSYDGTHLGDTLKQLPIGSGITVVWGLSILAASCGSAGKMKSAWAKTWPVPG